MSEQPNATQEAVRDEREYAWLSDVECAMLACIAERGAVTPAEISSRLDISEGEATALLTKLARENRIRVRQIEVGGDYKITVNLRPIKAQGQALTS